MQKHMVYRNPFSSMKFIIFSDLVHPNSPYSLIISNQSLYMIYPFIAIMDSNYAQTKRKINVIFQYAFNQISLYIYLTCLNIQEICDNYLEWSANTVNSRYNVDNMCALNLATLGSGYRAGYWRQLVTVLWRSYIVFMRNPSLIQTRLVAMVVMI